ncbi:RNA polymerase sigma factor (sigma-70 family) [Streptomyces puniciscabiei]|uniref:RNA polymerase sigma factor (Sigma-70 family) n=1 Tax=Streptomyces puniciscabiei TaxID=164348 RepID=A0A542SXM7_9ACTN|nr:RNA polymerase sigma factor (sigma-70 family) [Streptomyces puniciscabiei]
MSNDEIFAAAYREHYWAVSRYVARRLPGRAGEVEEVVAEVFTVAWRRRRELPDEPLPWLYGVARNCLANAVRGHGRRRRLLDRLGNDEAAHGRHVAHSPDAEAPGAWVHEALDRLSPADQEVLRLAAWEELDAGQIAVALGCGRRAATMRLHRARRRLRAEIDRMRPAPRAPATPPGRRTDPGAGEGDAPSGDRSRGEASVSGPPPDRLACSGAPVSPPHSGARSLPGAAAGTPERASPGARASLPPSDGRARSGPPDGAALPGRRPPADASADPSLCGQRPPAVTPESVPSAGPLPGVGDGTRPSGSARITDGTPAHEMPAEDMPAGQSGPGPRSTRSAAPAGVPLCKDSRHA